MANYATRAKEIIANIKDKDQTLPGTTFFQDMTSAFVYAYRGRWLGFLGSSAQTVVTLQVGESLVINPANQEDPTDIGVLVEETGVFTPISNGDTNKLKNKHYIREQRRFNREILKVYRIQTTAITAGDAGETADDFKAGVVAAATTESNTELGDDTNDPEA